MPHPHRRTWTLTGLDRDRAWRLWFDPVAFRWEVEDMGAREGVAVPPPSEAQGAAALPDAQVRRARWRR